MKIKPRFMFALHYRWGMIREPPTRMMKTMVYIVGAPLVGDLFLDGGIRCKIPSVTTVMLYKRSPRGRNLRSSPLF